MAQGLAAPDHIASFWSINVISNIGMLIAEFNQHGVGFGKIVTISYDDNDRQVYEIKYDKDNAKERLNESKIIIDLKFHNPSIYQQGAKVRRLKLSPIAKLAGVMVAIATTTILPTKTAQRTLLIYMIAIAIARTMTLTIIIFVPVLFQFLEM